MALTCPPAVHPRARASACRPPLASLPAGIEPNETLLAREDLTATIVRLRFRPDGGAPAFRAGQYAAVGLHLDGRFVQRPYSMASVPGKLGDLEFLVRLIPDGALTPSLWRLRPGDRVHIGPPKGLFTLAVGDDRQHLFLATGTGIAPLRSMLGSLLGRPPVSARDGRPSRPPVVVHGVATVLELAWRNRLERLASDGTIVYVPALSRPADPANAGWHGRTGRLDTLVETIAADVGIDPATTVVYLCGNPAMIAAVGPRLEALGVPAGAIRAERYWTPPAAQP